MIDVPISSYKITYSEIMANRKSNFLVQPSPNISTPITIPLTYDNESIQCGDTIYIASDDLGEITLKKFLIEGFTSVDGSFFNSPNNEVQEIIISEINDYSFNQMPLWPMNIRNYSKTILGAFMKLREDVEKMNVETQESSLNSINKKINSLKEESLNIEKTIDYIIFKKPITIKRIDQMIDSIQKGEIKT